MVHGPCGNANQKSPCMQDRRCTKELPKKFVELTIVEDDGYLIYRRRNNGRTIEKNHIQLDNCIIVPYNPKFLIQYQAKGHQSNIYSNMLAKVTLSHDFLRTS